MSELPRILSAGKSGYLEEKVDGGRLNIKIDDINQPTFDFQEIVVIHDKQTDKHEF